MSTRSLISVVLMAVAVMGCRGSETSLTGAYGSAVVAGQVIMGGELAGGSPAGVQVSVSGTGMMTTLGDDGRFSFIGVPRDAELRFHRSDAAATIRLEGATSPLIVELSATRATPSRRRGAVQKLEYEGTIVTVDATRLVLLTSRRQEVEVVIDAATVIRKGDQLMTPAQLEPEWRVHVKAVPKDGVKVATLIIVQRTGDSDDEGEDGRPTMTANGPVTAVNPLKVMSRPHGEITVLTDASTIIKKQGQPITVDQIVIGDEINSQGTRVDDHTLLARQIEVRGKKR